TAATHQCLGTSQQSPTNSPPSRSPTSPHRTRRDPPAPLRRPGRALTFSHDVYIGPIYVGPIEPRAPLSTHGTHPCHPPTAPSSPSSDCSPPARSPATTSRRKSRRS